MTTEEDSGSATNDNHHKFVSELLDDTETRELMIRKLREGSHVAKDPPSTGAGRYLFPFTTNMFPSTNNGTAGQAPWPSMFPYPITTPFPQCWGPGATVPTPGAPLPGSASLLGQPGSASSLNQDTEEEEEDMTLLDAQEVTEFTDFDPTVMDENTWEAGDNYLEKNFNREMTDKREGKNYEGLPKTLL